jgi:hypothetical protein
MISDPSPTEQGGPGTTPPVSSGIVSPFAEAADGAIMKSDPDILRCSGIQVMLSYADAKRSDYQTSWDSSPDGEGWICKHLSPRAQAPACDSGKVVLRDGHFKQLSATPAAPAPITSATVHRPQLIADTGPSLALRIHSERRACEMVSLWAAGHSPSVSRAFERGPPPRASKVGIRRWINAVRRTFRSSSLHQISPGVVFMIAAGVAGM